jgi:uncharacterized protein
MNTAALSSHALISSRCVNNCIFCAVAGKRQRGCLSSRDRVVQFMERMAAGGVRHFTFSGTGEPTMDEHFEEYLGRAKALGFRTVQLFTNGYALSEPKVVAWKALGLTDVLLSLHGLEQGHDANVRRKGAFKEAMRALELFLFHGLRVNINTCLTRCNLDEIEALCTTTAPYAVGRHMLSFPEWHGACLDNRDKLLRYEAVRRLTEAIDFYRFPKVVFDNVPFCVAQHRTRELRGLSPLVLLDANQEHAMTTGGGNIMPERCDAHGCPLERACCGFDRDYIGHHGWGTIPEMIDGFFQTFDLERLRPRSGRGPGYRLLPPQARQKRREPRAASEKKGVFNLTVKPTQRCNADCVYCAAGDFSGQAAMLSAEDAEKACAALAGHLARGPVGQLHVLWQGGEPLLMGRRYFERIFSFCRDHIEAPRVRHLMQSNLLALGDKWIALLRSFDVRLSTSAEPIIPGLRVFRDGSEQYPVWFDRFEMALDRGMAVGIVYTVTKRHLGSEKKIYAYFKNLLKTYPRCPGVRFNPVYASGGARRDDHRQLLLTPEEQVSFLAAMRAAGCGEERRLDLLPFKSASAASEYACTFSRDCSAHFMAIDGEGRVAPCGRFLDSGVFVGSIHEDSVEALRQRVQALGLGEARTHRLGETECRACPHLGLCNGGCPYLAHLYHGDAGRKDPFCEAYRALFGAADSSGNETERH